MDNILKYAFRPGPLDPHVQAPDNSTAHITLSFSMTKCFRLQVLADTYTWRLQGGDCATMALILEGSQQSGNASQDSGAAAAE